MATRLKAFEFGFIGEVVPGKAVVVAIDEAEARQSLLQAHPMLLCIELSCEPLPARGVVFFWDGGDY